MSKYKVELSFGGRDLVIEPVRGLKAIEALEAAMTGETEKFMRAAASGVQRMRFNYVPVLQAACPVFNDEELIEQSSEPERIDTTRAVLTLNRMDNFVAFLDFLEELPTTFRGTMKTALESAMKTLEDGSSTPSPLPVLAGTKFSTNSQPGTSTISSLSESDESETIATG